MGIYKSNNAEIWSGDSFGAKSDAAIFEILIFRDFLVGPRMADLDQNLDFDPLKNREKSKFQKSPHHFFVSSRKLSPEQISALLDL